MIQGVRPNLRVEVRDHGIGPVSLKQPRVRHRAEAADDPDRIRFSPTILLPYMRHSKSIDTLRPSRTISAS